MNIPLDPGTKHGNAGRVQVKGRQAQGSKYNQVPG